MQSRGKSDLTTSRLLIKAPCTMPRTVNLWLCTDFASERMVPTAVKGSPFSTILVASEWICREGGKVGVIYQPVKNLEDYWCTMWCLLRLKLVAPSIKLYTNCVAGLVLVLGYRVLQATVFKGLQEASKRRSLAQIVYTATRTCARPRNSIWFTRLMRGQSLGTTLWEAYCKYGNSSFLMTMLCVTYSFWNSQWEVKLSDKLSPLLLFHEE